MNLAVGNLDTKICVIPLGKIFSSEGHENHIWTKYSKIPVCMGGGGEKSYSCPDIHFRFPWEYKNTGMLPAFNFFYPYLFP